MLEEAAFYLRRTIFLTKSNHFVFYYFLGDANSILLIDASRFMGFFGDPYPLEFKAITLSDCTLFIFDHFLYSTSNHPLIMLFKNEMFLKYLREGEHGVFGTSNNGFCLFFKAVLLNSIILMFISLNSLIY
jgi:hypothetical protein